MSMSQYATLAEYWKAQDMVAKNAERYQWLVEYLVRHQLLIAEVCQPEAGMTPAPFWVLRAPAVIDRGSCLGYAKTEDAAIDAAMKETP